MEEKKTNQILDTSLVYYLSHPYTSYGEPVQNLADASHRHVELVHYHGIKIVNPVTILPFGLNNEVAMEKCRYLYDACDAIIMCPGWVNSRGCKEEFWWAKNDGKPIYIYDDVSVNKVE